MDEEHVRDVVDAEAGVEIMVLIMQQDEWGMKMQCITTFVSV